LTYIGPGTVVVEADQYGNATYTAASAVQRTIAVVAVVSYTAPTTAVNATSATQTATVNFTAAGTLGAINVLTQGATGLDFKFVTGGSCAVGTAYLAGQTCTVAYSFTPAAPGTRLGAVTLYSNAGTPVLLGTSYLGGTGTGPLGLFTKGVTSATVSGLNFATAATVDGAGDIFYGEQGTGKISEISVASGTVTVVATGINILTGLAIDGAGNLFYGSYGDNKVYELVGATGSPQFVANVSSPDVSMAVDDAGNLYVPGSDLVTKIAAGTFAVTTFGAVTGSVPGVTVDVAGNVYFADYSNNTIYKVATGTTTPVALVSSGLSGPRGLAVDAAGDLYVANAGASNLLKLTAGTLASTVIATGYQYDSLMMDQYGALRSGAGSSIVTVTRSATAASFTSTVIGNTANLAVSLENDGNAALSLSALGASGTGFTQASGTTTCSTTVSLAVAGTCNVGAAFTPQSAGTFTGDINITDNALNIAGSLQQGALTGTATAATPVVSVTGTSMNYGVSPTTLTVTVTYGGVQPTGAVTIQVDSGGTVTASCIAGSGSETCTASYGTSAFTVGGHTITAGIAADANYNLASSTGTLTVNDTLAGFTVTGIPTLVSPGVMYTATVTAIGASGAVFSVYNGTVTLSSTDTLAAFSPTSYAYQLANNGVHTFTVTFGTRGTQGVTATSGSATGSETGIFVGDLIWLVNANGSVSELSETGAALLSNAGNTSTASASGGMAFDSSGSVWSVTTGFNAVDFVNRSGTGAVSYTGAGLNAPASLAVDGNGAVWIANSNGSISLFANAGSPLAPSSGFIGGNLSSPAGIAIDVAGNVWVANSGNNSVTEILGGAAPSPPIATGTQNNTLGVRP